MLHEADAAIRALIERDVADGDDIEVSFETPTKEWAARQNTPTINAYLFDVREDVARRRMDPVPVRDDVGLVAGRRMPPRCYRLTYLVTAWTKRPEDEHRLLSSMLAGFVAHAELPRDVLVGTLADQSLPVLLSIGLPPPKERSIGEIWSAMGGELKPSLELQLSAPLVTPVVTEAAPPVREQPRLSLTDGADPARAGGATGAAGEGDGADPASGDVPEAEDGAAAGERTSGASAKRAAPSAAPTPARPSVPAAEREVAVAETVAGGTDQSGRVLTVQRLER